MKFAIGDRSDAGNCQVDPKMWEMIDAMMVRQGKATAFPKRVLLGPEDATVTGNRHERRASLRRHKLPGTK